MTKNAEANPNIQQVDDHSPSIINCRAGLNGTGLRGSLTDEEIEKVKKLPIVNNIGEQQATFKPCDCSKKSNMGNTSIAYHPREISSISEEIDPIIVVQALCLNIACKHNVGLPTKK